jgi:hypothetical protein
MTKNKKINKINKNQDNIIDNFKKLKINKKYIKILTKEYINQETGEENPNLIYN